jgi:hypothetical protein
MAQGKIRDDFDSGIADQGTGFTNSAIWGRWNGKDTDFKQSGELTAGVSLWQF